MLFKKDTVEMSKTTNAKAEDNQVDVVRQITMAFEKNGLKYSIRKVEPSPMTIISAAVSGQTSVYQVLFFVQSGEQNVSITTDSIAKFPAEKLPEMLELANELNLRFRFAKFVVDKENCCIMARGDIPSASGSVGDAAAEYLLRFISIIDEAGSSIMKTIWA